MAGDIADDFGSTECCCTIGGVCLSAFSLDVGRSSGRVKAWTNTYSSDRPNIPLFVGNLGSWKGCRQAENERLCTYKSARCVTYFQALHRLLKSWIIHLPTLCALLIGKQASQNHGAHYQSFLRSCILHWPKTCGNAWLREVDLRPT